MDIGTGKTTVLLYRFLSEVYEFSVRGRSRQQSAPRTASVSARPAWIKYLTRYVPHARDQVLLKSWADDNELEEQQDVSRQTPLLRTPHGHAGASRHRRGRHHPVWLPAPLAGPNTRPHTLGEPGSARPLAAPTRKSQAGAAPENKGTVGDIPGAPTSSM